MYVDTALVFCKEIFAETEKILVDQASNNLKFPQLIQLVSAKLNVSPDRQKVIDPFVRYYLKFHPDFHPSRGAKGGIEPMKNYQDRLSVKATKTAIKKELVAEIDARLSETEEAISAVG